MAIDIFLCVITGVIFTVIWVIAVYGMVYFQHPYDINSSIFPKIVVVLGMTITATNVLLLPLDVAQRGSAYGGLPMDFFWLAIYVLIAILGVIVLPFSVFFYEAEDPDSKTGKRCGFSILKTLIVFLIFAALVVVGYFFIGTAEIPIQVYRAPVIDLRVNPENGSFVCTARLCGVTPTGYLQNIKLSIFTFLIAACSAVGWIIFAIFGGIGLIALPLDLINDFRERPRPISAEVYTERKIRIGEKAETLIKQGLEVQKKGANRKQKNEWKNQAYLLDQAYTYNEIAYKKKGGPTIIYIIKLILGILSLCLSIMWILQIIIWTNLNYYPLLNYMLMAMDGVWGFFGVLFFGIFSFYLLLCVVKGAFKWGIRVPLLMSLHPIKKNATLLSSLLVNTNLVLAASVAVTHLCADSFSLYSRITAINSIFSICLKYLYGLSYYWMVMRWVLIGVTGLSIIFFIFHPTDKETKIYMRAQRQGKKV